MSVLDTIKANPEAIIKGTFGLAFAGISLYFLLIGSPDKADTINAQLAGFVVPVTSFVSVALFALSAMHFSRGPVPTSAAPVVVETVGQAKADGIMPTPNVK